MLRQDQKWIYGVIAGFAFFAALALGGRMAHSYNALSRTDQTARLRWAQVERSYQRRMEVTSSLTAIATQAAEFDQSIVREVIAAQNKVSKIDQKAVEQVETAQAELSAALTRLVATAARHPALNDLSSYRASAADLEAVEIRIQKDWDGFNEAAAEFNAQLNLFPSVLVSGLFRDHRFASKSLLKHPAEPKTGLNANAS